MNPRVILSSCQVETLLRLVRKGVGVSFLIDFIARQYRDIAVLPLTEPLPIEIGLAWKKDKYLSRASQAFIDFLTQSVKLTLP
jgi:DNA-binding transcriptional LysR family regulator